MKLLRCYIENFGTLHQYSVDFSKGLTVINECNGFGKTTLAVFLRTMFYGFPRSNKADLNKDLRRKYLPWQGGKFGGNIEFEHDGVFYRLERFFGEKAKQDSFTLYELNPLRNSQAFSENIGIELFGLDADSFERSTYMPQQHDTAPLSTSSIQAKLGNLVEDTNDINHFDKAVESLRRTRSAYIPYRGNGGSVSAAIQKISTLQSQQAECMACQEKLPALQEKMDTIRTVISTKEAAQEKSQQAISMLSQATAQNALLREKQAILAQQATCRQSLEDLAQHYPHGLPSEAQIAHISASFDALAALSADDGTASDYHDSCVLLEEHSELVAAGIPDQESVLQQQQLLQRYHLLRTQQADARLTAAEVQEYAALERFFTAGVPDASTLDKADTLYAGLLERRGALRSCSLSDAEQNELEQLDSFFHHAVPDDAEIVHRQQQMSQLAALQQENQLLSATDIPTAAASKNAAFLPCLVAGLLAASGGIVLFILKNYPIGGALLGIGVVLLIIAIYSNLRHMVSGKMAQNSLSAQHQAKMQFNAQQITLLQRSLSEFLAPFATEAAPLEQSLQEVLAKQRRYASLTERQGRMRQTQLTLQKEITQLNMHLQQFFAPYPIHQADFDAVSHEMREKRQRFLTLQQSKMQKQEQFRTLEQNCRFLEEQIATFLQPYCGAVKSQDFAATLAELTQHWDTLRHAQRFTQSYRLQAEKRTARRKSLQADINRFFADFGSADTSREGLQQLRDAMLLQQRLLRQQNELAQRLAEFTRQHGSLPDTPAQSDENMDELQQTAQQLRRDISALTETLLQLQQQFDSLSERADQLPAISDEIDYWKAQKAEYMQKAATLDDTIAALYAAKKSLSGTYLANIKEGFVRYLSQLNESIEAASVFMDHDLGIRLEQGGAMHELDSFSAGYSDIVMICMRLALIDALFGKNAPFLILDDPFVNLDDIHTSKALGLLQRLNHDHQIIYLVCHSSRC